MTTNLRRHHAAYRPIMDGRTDAVELARSVGAPAWVVGAPCRDDRFADDWFGGPDGQPVGMKTARDVAAALASAVMICGTCIRRADCRDLALEGSEHHGVWGGFNFETKRGRAEAAFEKEWA